MTGIATRRTTLLILAAALAGPLRAQHRAPDIVGYYPSWKWRSEAHPMTPAEIPFNALTAVNYAFFFPLPDGSIAGRDTTGDAMILGPDRARGTRATEAGLTALAHRKGVRVLLSIGGWEDSGNFPAVAAEPDRRAKFAHSCAERIRQFGFDGIDIDWEFPGYAEHGGTASDGENFVALLQTLRDTLDLLGARQKHRLELTAALPAVQTLADPMQVPRAAPLLDALNIMTYDFYGNWDVRAFHNAPLFASPGGDSARTVDGAFRLYRDTYRIPAGKINLGIPFYGHTYSGCTELLGSHGPPDTVHFPSGGATYRAIESQRGDFTGHRDPYAGVPYLTSTSWDVLVSYDDAASVAAKAHYARERGARGVIIWEITGDRMPDGSHPLLESLHGALQGKASTKPN